MVMSRRRMHQKDAIILAGLLGGVLLLLFSPLWGPMIWRAPASFSEPVAVSGQATKKEEKKETKEEQKQLPIVNEEGMTLAERIIPNKRRGRKGKPCGVFTKLFLKKIYRCSKNMGWKKGKGHHQHAGGFQTSVSKGESSVGRRFRDSIIYRVFVGKSNV